MKNYIIGTLGVIILVLCSILYKSEMTRNRFPVVLNAEARNDGVDVHLFLHVFFKKKNCPDCMEIIDVLNHLPPQFVVTGIVPQDELKDEKGFRRITGAAFPLISAKKYKRYIPLYSPAIIGVSPDGDILFVLPGVPGEKAYLEKFLDSLYNKLYPIFLKK
jgi:hypothetical protein